MNRLLWPLGILVLVGSVVGAGWALNHTTPQPSDDGADQSAPLPIVWCLGIVDVPDGVADLYPRQPGEVVEIAEHRVKDNNGEHDRVFKKGELLLRLRAETAENQLAKAKVALAAAEADLEKAQLLGPERKEKIAIQEAVIAAAREKKSRLEADLDVKRSSLQQNQGTVAKALLRAMEAAVNEADAAIKVEQGKLALIKLADPALEVKRAAAERDARKVDIKIAQDYVKEFRIEAPFDGIIMRLHTRVGEPFIPNPKVPAIEFCPDVPRIVRAEVVQQWADKVRVGQEVTIEDDVFKGTKWDGRVRSLSPWIAQKRVRVIEPLMMNDVRTLECIVDFSKANPGVRMGQRMRVHIKI